MKTTQKEHAAIIKLLNDILFEQGHMCLTVNGALKYASYANQSAEAALIKMDQLLKATTKDKGKQK